MAVNNGNNHLIKKSICPLDCPDSCGLVVTVSDGKVTSLQGDPGHPYTNGFICRKMRRYPDRLYDSERLLYPQIRVGKKGAGEFRRISWDESFEICSEKLLDIKKQFGGEAILPYSYAGNMGVVNRFAGYPLFHKLGTLQLDQTICSAAAVAGWNSHCSGIPGTPPENAAESDLIIAWGINVKVSNVHFWQYITTARKKGAKLVVIDPYRNQTAKSADIFIRVRPGGDSGLALGVCKLLVESDGIDRSFIETSTEGFEQLEKYLRQRDISQFIEESGVSREAIELLAESLKNSAKTFIRIGIGLSRNSRGAMSVRSITALAAVRGLFAGGEGRGLLLSSGAFSGNKELLVCRELQQKESRTVNMIHLAHALASKVSQIKALIVYNANPLSVNPDAAEVREGLARSDLFTVVHEQVMTPTAKYADLLLPATTFLENHDLYTAYGHFYLGVAAPVVAPLGEAKSNFDFFQELASRMGFEDPPFLETCQERIRAYLDSIKELAKETKAEDVTDGHYVRSTKSMVNGDYLIKEGLKYRFQAFSEPTIPTHACIIPAGESQDPDLLTRFPLYLITPPHPDLLNSTFGERYMEYPGELLLHPDDARERKVHDGGAVIIRNNRGRARRIARITTDTDPGVVVAEGLYWPVSVAQEGEGEQAGINDLTSQKLTDLGGGATFHESLVEVEAAN